jgi:type I restriction-modification system DNA methylase subunit/predicted nucleotidyltransferase
VNPPSLLDDAPLTLPETGEPIDPGEAFRYFLLFFRPDAFRPEADGARWLDSVLQGSAEYARAVEDALKPRAYRAVTVLCRGLAASSGTDAEQLEKDRDLARIILDNALTLLFRLLFILYAESRDLLPVHSNSAYRNKSLLALRERSRRIRDGLQDVFPHGRDLWRDLHDLFQIIDGHPDWRAVGVPVYNGGLFAPAKHTWLEQHEVPDRELSEAIDLLSRVDDPYTRRLEYVDYGPLDVRHLGSIYEGLLEFAPRFALEDLPGIREAGVIVRDPVPAAALYLADDSGERKATGSFYTPDYVVEYIVAETIGPLVADRTLEEILDLRILDPAMGSGHFLVSATSFLARAAVRAAESVADETEARTPEDLRRLVVERCIFGVDRNPRAVELAKLALWLATVQRDKPLNFLDHHLKCGDSLLGARIERLGSAPLRGGRERQLEQAGQFNAFHAAFSQRVLQMLSLVHMIEWLPSDTLADVEGKERLYRDADRLLGRFRDVADLWCSAFFGNSLDAPAGATGEGGRGALYGRVLDQLHATAESWVSLLASPALERAKSLWREHRFFHWQLEFAELFFDRHGNERENPGFDAVIGNPPYVRMEAFTHIKDFLRAEYETYETRSDLYVYFMERSLDLLRRGGQYGVIVSNKFLRANYGRPLRRLLAREAGIREIVDFGGLPVFPEATVRAAIVLATKGAATNPRFTEVADLQFTRLHDIIVATGWEISATLLGSDEWILAADSVPLLIQRLWSDGIRLTEKACAPVCWGIKTGLNAAFIVDASTRRLLIQQDPRSNELLKPLVRGKDIRRYVIEPCNHWIIYISSDTRITEYPAIEAHLSGHRDALDSRSTRQEWYALQQPQLAYQPFFDRAKIVFPDMSQEPRFAIAMERLYPNNTCYFIPLDSYALLAVLNSALSAFCVQHTAARLEGQERGEEYVRFHTQYVEHLPLPSKLSLDATGDGGGDLGAWLRTLYHRGLRRAGIEPEVPEDIRAMGTRIGELRDIERVLLVGSWARGQGRADSDVDLLVVCREDGGPVVWRQRIRRHLGRLDRPLDLLIYTPEQLTKGSRAAASPLGELLADGIELYGG